GKAPGTPPGSALGAMGKKIGPLPRRSFEPPHRGLSAMSCLVVPDNGDNRQRRGDLGVDRRFERYHRLEEGLSCVARRPLARSSPLSHRLEVSGTRPREPGSTRNGWPSGRGNFLSIEG